MKNVYGEKLHILANEALIPFCDPSLCPIQQTFTALHFMNKLYLLALKLSLLTSTQFRCSLDHFVSLKIWGYPGFGVKWIIFPLKLVKIFSPKSLSSTSIKCWRACAEKGTLVQRYWEYKVVQPQWRTVWKFLKK